MSSLTNVTTQSSRGRSTSSNVQDQDQDSVERLRLRSLAEKCDKFILEVLLHTLPSGGSRISQTLGWPIPEMGAKPIIWQDFVKNGMKMNEIGRLGVPCASLDSPMLPVFKVSASILTRLGKVSGKNINLPYCGYQ